MKKIMNPNIQSYIDKLKYFFEKNPYFYHEIFGSFPENIVFVSICQLAEKNYLEFGEPNLTREQMESIRKDMDQNQVSEVFLDFLNYPPICLN